MKDVNSAVQRLLPALVPTKVRFTLQALCKVNNASVATAWGVKAHGPQDQSPTKLVIVRCFLT
jgi:hypothetical protein